MSQYKLTQITQREADSLKYFVYSQNNSGGVFEDIPDQGLGYVTIIEAISATHADAIAVTMGMDFADTNEFSGDRWTMQNSWFIEEGLQSLDTAVDESRCDFGLQHWGINSYFINSSLEVFRIEGVKDE